MALGYILNFFLIPIIYRLLIVPLMWDQKVSAAELWMTLLVTAQHSPR